MNKSHYFIHGIPNLGYYRLPNGNITTDVNHYINEWDKLACSIESILGAKVYSCDPELSIYSPDGKESFSLPVWAALKIADLKEGKEQ